MVEKLISDVVRHEFTRVISQDFSVEVWPSCLNHSEMDGENTLEIYTISVANSSDF